MHKFLMIFIALILSVSEQLLAQEDTIRIAWLSDTHFNSFANAEEDLLNAVNEINNSNNIDFIIISGDIVEFGETDEFRRYKEIISHFNKPYKLVTGNHDVNWSENGCTAFESFFGNTHFTYDFKGYRFIGIGAGPMLRMGAPCYPFEEIKWLKSTVDTTEISKPIIFISHYPMDEIITNSDDVIKILKTKDIELILSGHEHKNAMRSFYGIPGLVGRSILRRKSPSGGYNIISITNKSVSVSEKIIGGDLHKPFALIKLKRYDTATDSCKTDISYSINSKYSNINEIWRIEERSDITAQGTLRNNLYIYNTVSGFCVAVNAKDGKELWRFKTGNKIHSSPYITARHTYISSGDGYIYALNNKNGQLKWKRQTHYPIVASPYVENNILYIGSSNGNFYAINTKNGNIIWLANFLQGFVEARAAVDKNNIYIGTWGAKFYAINKLTGKAVWTFDTGKGRYFSPGACWPVIIGNHIWIQSSDYYLRAFNKTGDIAFETNTPKGRESIGISKDKKVIYVQGIGKNITAIDTHTFKTIWETNMPYKENYIPTRIVSGSSNLYIGSALGVVYAIGNNGSGIKWEHKISNSAITSFCTTNDGGLIIMTMDGKIVKLMSK